MAAARSPIRGTTPPIAVWTYLLLLIFFPAIVTCAPTEATTAAVTATVTDTEVTPAEIVFEAAFQGECRSNGPCQHLCFDLHDGTFECACKGGYTLADNGYSCIENSLLEAEKSLGIEDINATHVSREGRIKQITLNEKKDFKERGQKRGGPAKDLLFNSCLQVECEAGGICVAENESQSQGSVGSKSRKKRIRCRCPLGRGGVFCEKPSEARFPRFRGTSYLALPTLRDAHKSMQLTVGFRPEHHEGLLLYSGEKQTLEGDFVALLLNQGFVEFRFDCGMGEGVLRSERPVLLNSWNSITIYRDGWTGWMVLNGGQQISGQSQGLFSRITFRLELFLGGSPNLTLVADRTNSFTGFNGCVRKLEINGRLYDFRSDNRGDAIDGVDVEECSADICSRTSCLNGGQCVASSPDRGICLCPLGYAGEQCEAESDFTVPSFNGSSYLQFPGFGDTLNSFFEIQLVFKPRASDGILLYNGHRMDGGGDFISLNLVDGYVEFRFDLGNGPSVIRSLDTVSKDEWHSLSVSRTARKGILEVDDQPQVEGYSLGAFTQLSLPLNLFVGGVADIKDVSRDSGLTQSFTGCVQKVTVNGRSIMLLEEALFGVNVVDCPHPCTSEPCLKGGRCEPQMDLFTCHCPIGRVGNKCEKEVDEMIAIPMFYGNSFLHYLEEGVMKRIRGSKMDLRLRFRAFSPEGVLLWSGDKEPEVTGSSDFMSLSLRDGLLRYSFNLGSGEVNIVYNYSRVDDGLWHNLRMTRFKREGTLLVDSGPLVTGASPGPQIQLNVNNGLFLGGLEDIAVQTRHKHKKGIIGCFSHITLATDYHLHLVTQATRGVNIRPCI